jgi:hypothetical protein
MTCGVIVPVNVELLDDALYDSTAWLPLTYPNWPKWSLDFCASCSGYYPGARDTFA